MSKATKNGTTTTKKKRTKKAAQPPAAEPKQPENQFVGKPLQTPEAIAVVRKCYHIILNS